jgi:hypothetical protein
VKRVVGGVAFAIVVLFLALVGRGEDARRAAR